MRRYIAAVDIFLNIAAVFAACIILMLPLLNPPTEDAKTEPPGDIHVEIMWNQGPIDVDLWVDGPTEARPVGYSNLRGIYWNLLRDDLGTAFDPEPANTEDAYTRGIQPGEHVINVMCYRCPTAPITVWVKVTIFTGSGRPKPIADFTVKLLRQGEEKTALRFTLDKNRSVVAGSLHNVFRPLRSAKK